MEHIMITCISGVMYSGELLKEYNDNAHWVGIKPSSNSDINMFFSADKIKKIYFQNGSSMLKGDSELEKSEESNFDIPKENIVLIRVKGGVSYRGERLMKIPDAVEWKDGYWILPNSANEMIIYIPEHEIEKVYTL